MSIWLFFIRISMMGAAPLALRQGGAQDNWLHKAGSTPAVTTVPPSFVEALAFREANLQEQVNHVAQTLAGDELRLAHITASMTNATAQMAKLTATVAADKSLMTGTSSILKTLQTHYSRQILESKYNTTKAAIDAATKDLQNVSNTFEGSKGKKTDTTDITKKVDALNITVTLNSTAVGELLDNFSKMEDVLSYNVSEYVGITVQRHTEDVFRNITYKFADLVDVNKKALEAGKPCDIVPNLTLCTGNRTNATTAKATTFLQVLMNKVKTLASGPPE